MLETTRNNRYYKFIAQNSIDVMFDAYKVSLSEHTMIVWRKLGTLKTGMYLKLDILVH